jgi:mannose-6-phosphate isomerase
MQRWVHKWYDAFVDPDNNGFHERLDSAFQPVITGQRRVLTQCRQLAMYSDASMRNMGRDFKPALEKHFTYLVDTYHVGKGCWRFSVDEKGEPLDNSYDLYAHAFVIFALSHYFRATGDEEARRLADLTIENIHNNFRMEGLPGFAEALDTKLNPIQRTRRHESHMHLLEACLFAAAIWEKKIYGYIAGEMVDLFNIYFYDPENITMGEYYSEDLESSDGGQVIVEPGHYYEWIWLLKKYGALSGDNKKYDDICKPMIEWANKHGWDNEYGGIYDELSPDGSVIEETKRLWPFSEAIKANALMLDSEGVKKQELKNSITKMVRIFRDYYMKERGFWVEWLSRDLSSSTDYMPGTTPYHVYFGVMEAMETLHGRGRSKSLLSSAEIALYTLRRNASSIARDIRDNIKKRA